MNPNPRDKESPNPHDWRNLYHAADELRRMEVEQILPPNVPVVVEGIEPGEHLFFLNHVTADEEALLVCCETAADFVAFRFGLGRMADEEVSDEGTSSLILSLSGLRVVSFLFCDRSRLAPDEVDRFRRLRIRYREGGAVWPSFLSFFGEPGSSLTRGEVLRLTHGFEVLASFLPDIAEQPDAFFMEDEDELLLLHTVEGEKGVRLWQEGWGRLEDLLVEFPDIEEMVDQLDNPDHPGWTTIAEGVTRGRATYIIAQEEFTPEQINLEDVDQPRWGAMMFESLDDEGIFGIFDPEKSDARKIAGAFLRGLEGVRKLPSGILLFDEEMKDMLTPLAARLDFDLKRVDDPDLHDDVREAILDEVHSRLGARTILPLPVFYYSSVSYATREGIEEGMSPAGETLYYDLTVEIEKVIADFPDQEYLDIAQKILATLAAEERPQLYGRAPEEVVAAVLYLAASRNELWTDTYTPERLAELYDSTVEAMESLAAEIFSDLELDSVPARLLHSRWIERHPDQVWMRDYNGYVCDVRELPDLAQDMLFVGETIPCPPHCTLAVAIEKALPMTFYILPEYLERLNQAFLTDITSETPLPAEKVGAVPLLQGLAVGVRLDQAGGRLIPLPLSSLRCDPDHPLADDIELYQERKARSLDHIEAMMDHR